MLMRDQNFSNALHSSMTMKEARFRHGLTNFQLKDSRAAQDDFEFLIENDDMGSVNVALAHITAALNQDLQRAAALYEQAIGKGYRSAIVLNNLGYCPPQERAKHRGDRGPQQSLRPSILVWERHFTISHVFNFNSHGRNTACQTLRLSTKHSRWDP